MAAISPAIDFHTRYYEGDETIPQMFADDPEAEEEQVFPHVRMYHWDPQVLFFLASGAPLDVEKQMAATGRPSAAANRRTVFNMVKTPCSRCLYETLSW